MMLGNGVRTQILSGQRITVTWPRAVRDHACGGAALVAIMSHASSDNPSANSWRNTPPMLTCLLRRPSASQWESSSPAISQRFSRSMRSRGVSPLFPSVTCFLHVVVSPASSTWCLQIAPHPIISPDALAISASCHSPAPQGIPLLCFLVFPGLGPSGDPGSRPSGDPGLRPSGLLLDAAFSGDPGLRPSGDRQTAPGTHYDTKDRKSVVS